MPRVHHRSRAAALDAELHRRGHQIRDPQAERVRLPRLAAALLIAALSGLIPASAEEATLDAAPGDYPDGTAGYILTALEGDEIVKIPLTYLGKFERFLGPEYGIHLIRLEGPIAERVGIASGMSGSPVYIEGRLIGALAYRMGQLPKEAVGGVTPIEAIRAASRSAANAPPESDVAAPILTPISASGLHPAVRDWMREGLNELGIVWVDALGSAGGEETGNGFEPGSPIGVALARGDMSFAATGTVTTIEDGVVYAFGHPFLATGAVRFPMHAAEVVHTLSDASGSRKMAKIGAERGTITDDRLTAIAGTLGQFTELIDVNVRVRTGDDEPRTSAVEIVDTPGVTPLLAAAAVSNTVLQHVDAESSGTLMASGIVRLDGYPDLPFELSTAAETNNPAVAVAFALQSTLAALWNNPFERPKVDSIDVEVRVEPEIHSYFLESLQYDREKVEPGGTLRVHAVLKPWRGDKVRRELTLRLPHGLAAGKGLRVAVGPPDQIERALGSPLARRLSTAEDLAGVLDVLTDMKSPHRLVAVLYDDSPTVVRDGLAFSALPATAAHLLSVGSRSGRAAKSPVARLATTQIELDGPVGGGLKIGVTVGGKVSTEAPEESPE